MHSQRSLSTQVNSRRVKCTSFHRARFCGHQKLSESYRGHRSNPTDLVGTALSQSMRTEVAQRLRRVAVVAARMKSVRSRPVSARKQPGRVATTSDAHVSAAVCPEKAQSGKFAVKRRAAAQLTLGPARTRRCADSSTKCDWDQIAPISGAY